MCPANITQGTDLGICRATVSYAAPNVSDNCGATAELLSGLPSLSGFTKGSTLVTYKATDATGLSNRCSFSVRVFDGEAPVIGKYYANSPSASPFPPPHLSYIYA